MTRHPQGVVLSVVLVIGVLVCVLQHELRAPQEIVGGHRTGTGLLDALSRRDGRLDYELYP